VSAGRHGVANEGVGSGPAVGQNPGRDVLTTWARVALRTVDRQHQRERSTGHRQPATATPHITGCSAATSGARKLSTRSSTSAAEPCGGRTHPDHAAGVLRTLEPPLQLGAIPVHPGVGADVPAGCHNPRTTSYGRRYLAATHGVRACRRLHALQSRILTARHCGLRVLAEAGHAPNLLGVDGVAVGPGELADGDRVGAGPRLDGGLADRDEVVVPVRVSGRAALAYWLSYSSWRRHQWPVSLRPSGARSSHCHMPHRVSSPRVYVE
jgi:hypothetical protein